ncbi:MAG: asparaginase [Actinobacteria bacterium]|nr:asparaginase [Actinomycetota bacterium]
MSNPEALAEVIRNENSKRNQMVESIHLGHLVILDSSGGQLLTRGDVLTPIFPRSSIKPIQARAMVKLGLDIDPDLLALVCASHSGAIEHLAGVRRLLAQFGLDESALKCSPDLPLGEIERKLWGEKPPSRITMNCSGKHAGMLATCVINGWPTENYLAMDHPLQVAIKNEIESSAGEQSANDSFDGCGAPLFAITISGLAKAIASVLFSTDSPSDSIVRAMTTHPMMVAGGQRLSTRWMKAKPGLIMKEGAEGVHITGHRDHGVVAFKVIDGSMRAHEVITRRALAHLGITDGPAPATVFGGPAPSVSIRPAF